MGSIGSLELKCRVKVEGELLSYVKPIYGKPSEIILDIKAPIVHSQITRRYKLCKKLILIRKGWRLGKTA
jgi:hypothetical protein